ncbi:protein moonraker [Anolis carolinensis]|uniref:protein moonraker n=1 Tax=Anolis carolinensis TaxID=28377 RepID=UPI002F2B7BF2
MAGGLLLPTETQQQLRFSLEAPSVAEGPPARFASPLPIVIEKLKKVPEGEALGGGDRGHGDGGGPAPLTFSAVSEETLRRAVRLAKRDLKRRPRKEDGGHPVRSSSGSQRETTTGTAAKVFLSKPTRLKATAPRPPDSPPTRDVGPVPVAPKEEDEEERSAREVRRLQKELQGYVRKVEALARKERTPRPLDPEERRRARIRGQEQAARSARTLYVLRQQVKEIQDDLEKLSPHHVRHTKKSRAMARLAAAHRGAARALQAVLSRWTLDWPEDEEDGDGDDAGRALPWAQCRELGQLLRQLSLCSVQMEASSTPDTPLDLMMQIEGLDSLLARKAPLVGGAADPPPAGPPRKKEKAIRKRPPGRKRPTPGPPSRPWPAGEHPHTGEPPGSGEGPPKASPVAARRKGPPARLLTKEGFREPTLSFRMKEVKPPLKGGGRTPRVPPTSAPPQRSAAEKSVLAEKEEEQGERAVLEPLLERVQKATLSLEKSGGRMDREDGPRRDWDPHEGPPSQREEVTDVDLGLAEEMLRRMQEIERSQEAVRRRYHRLVYSDVEFCAPETKDNSEGLAPPAPIWVTQSLSRKEEPQVDIVLERPSDTNAVQDEEEGSEEGSVCPCPRTSGAHRGPGGGVTFLHVPQDVLQGLADYRSRFQQHLRLMAHEAVGSFDPWRIAESLAESLAEESVAEVAVEVGGLCEDWAEAVFVSEFLQTPTTEP